MREITASGRTIEEAKENALSQLALDESQVKVDVIDEEKKDFSESLVRSVLM